MPTCSRPPILCLRSACHGTCEQVTGRERHARSAADPHTCNDEDAQELVAAYAPLMLASAVHFFRAASLIDSSTRWAAAAAAAQAAAFLQILVKGVPRA